MVKKNFRIIKVNDKMQIKIEISVDEYGDLVTYAVIL